MSAEFTPAVHAVVNERSGGVCEVCGAERAWDKHHRHPRKSGGTRREWIGLPSNCLDVCRSDHNLIESRRQLARVMGWLVPEGHDPADVPVLYRGRWLFLGSDGGLQPIQEVI